MSSGSPLSGGARFNIAVDGDLVPQATGAALRSGVEDDIPLLIGTTSDEYRLWMSRTARSTASGVRTSCSPG